MALLVSLPLSGGFFWALPCPFRMYAPVPCFLFALWAFFA